MREFIYGGTLSEAPLFLLHCPDDMASSSVCGNVLNFTVCVFAAFYVFLQAKKRYNLNATDVLLECKIGNSLLTYW